MEYFWYKIFNTTEFDALGVESKNYTLKLENLGEQDVLVTKGNLYGLTYQDVFLTLDLNNRNAFEFDGFAVLKADSGNVYLGVPK